MPKYSEIAILGAGVIGLTCAVHLLQRGHQVTIIERDRTGSGSSNAAGGILLPLSPWSYEESLTKEIIRSNQLLPAFVSELKHTTGVDAQCLPSGVCYLDSTLFSRLNDITQKFGLAANYLDRNELEKQIGAVSPLFSSGFCLHGIHQIHPPLFMSALRKAFIQLGGNLIEQCEATSLNVNKARHYELITSKGAIACEQVIVALGAWAQSFLDTNYFAAPPVFPVKGQMLEFSAPVKKLSIILINAGYYLIPRADGTIVAGSTLEETGFDDATSESARNEIAHHAIEAWPALADCEITRHWAGLRPGSLGNIPFVDRHPELPGVFLSYGHYRYGIALSLQSAYKIVDLVEHPSRAA